MKNNYLVKLIKNKVFLYLGTRYLTYFVQFVTSVLIAVKLGSYYWGVWSFILLMISYFQIFNLGIENASNILLVQNKDDVEKFSCIIKNSLVCLFLISLFICLIAGMYWYFDWSFSKYNIGHLFYYVCIIGVLIRFNHFFMTVYRVRNRLFEIAFYQSIIPILLFVSLFWETGEDLLHLFIYTYILGHILSLALFLKNKQILWGGCINTAIIKTIFSKGICLFVYNVCFYLIIISTKSVISVFYSVKEFGYFAFSYTLANAILLLLESFSFIVFPKIIKKFSDANGNLLYDAMEKIRVNYISLAHGLIYLAISIFPILLIFVPEYSSTLPTLNLVALSVLMYTNSFGYNSLLMARGEEKRLAKVSLICLCLNILLAFLLAFVLRVAYNIVVLSTLLSYFTYSFLCTFYGRKKINITVTFQSVLADCMPMNLLLPYISAIIIAFSEIDILFCIPLVIYICANRMNLSEIVKTIKQIITNPNIINV